MENRKTFGAYILRRRTELGMTQKELSEKLFVTESAVSKWERGLSYPDITLIRSLCEILKVSEHELLTGSDDTEQRNSERLAAKYLRLTRRYRVAQYIIYGLSLLACFIVNLSVSHRLDWFFIVLFSVAVAASITLVPAVADKHPKAENYKAPIALGCFVLSLELLLLTCCIYAGGHWFLIAGIACLLGVAVFLLPLVIARLPLPPAVASRKTSAWLLLTLALLLLLLLVCCLYTGGDWFGIAAISVVFGLGFFILPVLLHQLPLPEQAKQHKALIYFAFQTAMIFILIAAADGVDRFLRLGLPVSLISIALPWGLMLIIRYLPSTPLTRAGCCCALGAVWVLCYPYTLTAVLDVFFAHTTVYLYGQQLDGFPGFSVNLLDWGPGYISANIAGLTVAVLAIAAAVLICAGLRKKKK